MQSYIIHELAACTELFFGCKQAIIGQRTKLIKDRLSLLGAKSLKNKPSYKVYANRISEYLRQSHGGKFKNVEWLYDLHWYTEAEDDDYIPTGLPLVVECEWSSYKPKDGRIPFGAIKYDFQKLLVCNAELRLMIFTIRKDDDLVVLDHYFTKAINSYNQLAENSEFLFIGYDRRIGGFHYCEKKKLPPTTAM